MEDEKLYSQLDLDEFEQVFSAYQHKEEAVDNLVNQKSKVSCPG